MDNVHVSIQWRNYGGHVSGPTINRVAKKKKKKKNKKKERKKKKKVATLIGPGICIMQGGGVSAPPPSVDPRYATDDRSCEE